MRRTVQDAPDLVDGADAAYERHLPDLLTMPAERVEHVHFDVIVAINRAIIAAHNLRPHADGLITLPNCGADDLDRLHALAKVLYAADQRLHAHRPDKERAEVPRRARAVRAELTAYARVLITRGRLPADALAGLSGGASHGDLALDLRFLCKTYRRNWSAIEPVALYTSEEIDAFMTLAGRVFSLSAHAKLTGKPLTPRQIRSRAFTLLKRHYLKLRRAAAYTLEGVDINELIPQFTVIRGRTTRVATDTKAPQPSTTEAPRTDASGRRTSPLDRSP